MSSYVIAGVDYSITSPAICLHYGKEWNPKCCAYHYFDKPKNQDAFAITKDGPYFHPSLYPEWNHPMERYSKLSNWALMQLLGCRAIGLEGYSYGSRGMAILNMAENGGIFRYKLWKEGKTIIEFAPKDIKKQATGYGNANKELMIKYFTKENGFDIIEEMGITTKSVKPADDIADAYYIAKFTFEQWRRENE